MRVLTEHKVNPANDQLTIEVTDALGAGGANHRYEVTGFDTKGNVSNSSAGYRSEFTRMIVLFQNGPIQEAGVNGITHEALLAIVADRLRSFQDGGYACKENAEALTAIENAQNWLNRRTLRRMQQGIEGTHQAGPEDHPRVTGEVRATVGPLTSAGYRD